MEDNPKIVSLGPGAMYATAGMIANAAYGNGSVRVRESGNGPMPPLPGVRLGGVGAVYFDWVPDEPHPDSIGFVDLEGGGEASGAYLAASFLDFEEPPLRRLQVEWIEVGEPYRRRGVATRLYQEAAQYARGHGAALMSDTRLQWEAREFWEKQHRLGNADRVDTGHQTYYVLKPEAPALLPNRRTVPGPSFDRVTAVFDEAFDEVEGCFPDIGTVELHDDEAAGADNGAGAERQFAYCKDGDPIVIAFAPKAEELSDSQLQGLMRHEFGHALEYRYGVAVLEERFSRLPEKVERRADAIAEAVWGEPVRYDTKNIQCVGRGKSPRPRHLPDAKEKLKANSRPHIIGPVYRAQPRDFALHDGPLYWADRPRVEAFGTYVIKAKLRVRNPYLGSEVEAWDVVTMLTPAQILSVLEQEADEGYEPNIYESPGDQLVELLTNRHAEGVWQGDLVLAAIKKNEFDGVISFDPHGGEREYVVFSPSQVKVLDTFRQERASSGLLSDEKEKLKANPNATLVFIKLYHGTCEENAKALEAYGWEPQQYPSGAQRGQTRFLYLTNGYENAMWYAEARGCDAVLEVEVPRSALRVDPEDGVAPTVEEELAWDHGLPGNVVAVEPLSAGAFRRSLGRGDEKMKANAAFSPALLYHGTTSARLGEWEEAGGWKRTDLLYLAEEPDAAASYAECRVDEDEDELGIAVHPVVLAFDVRQLLRDGELMPDWDDAMSAFKSGEYPECPDQWDWEMSLERLGTVSYRGPLLTALQLDASSGL